MNIYNTIKTMNQLQALQERMKEHSDEIENILLDEWPMELSEKAASLNMNLKNFMIETDNAYANFDALKQMEEKSFLARSSLWYEQSKTWYNEDTIAKLREQDLFETIPSLRDKFNTFIHNHSSWQFASLYIRPGKLQSFNALKASDLLYVAEQCDISSYLESVLTLQEFKMMKLELIDETKNKFLIDQLPLGQFGIIVMENFLNYKPIEIIEQYLMEAHELLANGGAMIFTYNNCDLISGIKLFDEHKMYAFTPGYLVYDIINKLDFEILDDFISDRVNYICLKKKGKKNSLKGGKTLGEITVKG